MTERLVKALSLILALAGCTLIASGLPATGIIAAYLGVGVFLGVPRQPHPPKEPRP